jgi:adenylate cyclase
MEKPVNLFRGLHARVFVLFFAVTATVLGAAFLTVHYFGKAQIEEAAENEMSLVNSVVLKTLESLPRGAGLVDEAVLAQNLRKLTGIEVSFFDRETLRASSWPSGGRDAFTAGLKPPSLATGGLLMSQREIKGERVLEGWGRWGKKNKYYLLQRSLDEEMGPLHHLEQLLLFIGVAVLILSGLVSFGFSQRITQPLEELVRGTQLVIEGRYDQRLPVRRNDEMGRLAESFNRMLAGLQERERFRSAMQKVVSREIADELLKGEIKLGGEIRFASVLFADIRGFTGLSESIAPQQLVGFLNEYLTLMGQAVERNHGVIDKYMGDSIMAVFGAPLSHATDVDNCLQTALDMIWCLKEFNYRRAWQSERPISMSIGINTGPVVAGNMGSEDRLNYTVLGDAVNLAYRLEGLTRLYCVDCIVSEFTLRECKANFHFRELDLVRVKGRSGSVRIFELWNPREPVENLSEMFQKFQNARKFYLLRDWSRAEDLFREVLEMRPKDGPSQLYLSRIQQLRQAPPPDNWDGVYIALTK